MSNMDMKITINKKNDIADHSRNTKLSENNISNDTSITNNINTFENLLSFVKKNKDLSLYTILIDQIRVIKYEPYSIKVNFVKEDYQTFFDKIKKSLQSLTNKNWRIEVIDNDNESKSISEKNEIKKEDKKNKIKENIIVKSIFDEFPESEILEIKSLHDNKED